MRHLYRGRQVALLTRHAKSATIGPVLQDGLAIELVVTDAFDTDLLGTFSGEIARALPAHRCGLRKAELAIELTGLDVGIGSEGTFGPGPLGGLMAWNIEFLVWHDRTRDWTITGRSQGPSQASREALTSVEQAIRFAAGAPVGQGLIVRGNGQVFKALHEADTILEAASACLSGRRDEPASIEFDLRACHSPERRARIEAATHDLVARLLALCPRCGRPDFSPDDVEYGRPCAECDAPTPLVSATRAVCLDCGFTARQAAPASYADPAYCPHCNP